MKFFTTFTLAATLFVLKVTAEGCQDCAGMTGTNRDGIFNDCVAQCEGALNDKDNNAKYKCRGACDDIVKKNNCCYNGCSQHVKRWAHYDTVEDLTLTPRRDYNFGEVEEEEQEQKAQPTSSKALAVVPSSEELEKRDGAGCCAACETITPGLNWCRRTIPTMALAVARLACAYACFQAYGAQCRVN